MDPALGALTRSVTLRYRPIPVKREEEPLVPLDLNLEPRRGSEHPPVPWEPVTRTGKRLQELFLRMFEAFGPQHWWPAETPFEVMVGAVLTQNTNWKNVEKAIGNLKAREVLSPRALHALDEETLAEMIRPAGYYNIKARRLKALVTFLMERHDGDLQNLFRERPGALREALLSVRGIGPETADSILLYAGGIPSFVVDAYTFRILARHGLCEPEGTYEELQTLFMDHLPPAPPLFNEFHALLVRTGKDFCRKTPKCDRCPVRDPGEEAPGV